MGRTGQASDHVQQHVVVLPSYQAKKQWLQEMLPTLANVGRTLVFVASKADCEAIAQFIREAHPSLVLETLHGDRHPTDRHAALKSFAKGRLAALVATDVASRGLDVSNVSTVVNFDPAKNLDIHVHRVGRAGRLEKHNGKHQEGTAYTLLINKNADFAFVLMGAFEREGRTVSSELRALAQRSRRNGNMDSRVKRDRSGLGIPTDSDKNNDHRDQGSRSRNEGGATGYYGPASSTSAASASATPTVSVPGSASLASSTAAVPSVASLPSTTPSTETTAAPPRVKKSRWS